MIKRQKKTCIECGIANYIFSKGRCEDCSRKAYAKKSQEKKSSEKTTTTNKEKISTGSNKKEKLNLSPYFMFHVQQMEKHPYCDNCKIKIQPSHFNAAHILPKSKYKSVANNLDNGLHLCTSILGGNGCHEDFDKLQNSVDGILQALNPGCVNLLINKFDKIKNLVSDNEKTKREYQVLLELRS